jgi:hypothetical protein
MIRRIDDEYEDYDGEEYTDEEYEEVLAEREDREWLINSYY